MRAQTYGLSDVQAAGRSVGRATGRRAKKSRWGLPLAAIRDWLNRPTSAAHVITDQLRRLAARSGRSVSQYDCPRADSRSVAVPSHRIAMNTGSKMVGAVALVGLSVAWTLSLIVAIPAFNRSESHMCADLLSLSNNAVSDFQTRCESIVNQPSAKLAAVCLLITCIGLIALSIYVLRLQLKRARPLVDAARQHSGHSP